MGLSAFVVCGEDAILLLVCVAAVITPSILVDHCCTGAGAHGCCCDRLCVQCVELTDKKHITCANAPHVHLVHMLVLAYICEKHQVISSLACIRCVVQRAVADLL